MSNYPLKIIHSFNFINPFYDLFCHICMSPDSHLKVEVDSINKYFTSYVTIACITTKCTIRDQTKKFTVFHLKNWVFTSTPSSSLLQSVILNPDLKKLTHLLFAIVFVWLWFFINISILCNKELMVLMFGPVSRLLLSAAIITK